MPKGVPKNQGHIDALWAELTLALERIADLERRLEKANEYFQKGYVPPHV